jgi:hypothetical protein
MGTTSAANTANRSSLPLQFLIDSPFLARRGMSSSSFPFNFRLLLRDLLQFVCHGETLGVTSLEQSSCHAEILRIDACRQREIPLIPMRYKFVPWTVNAWRDPGAVLSLERLGDITKEQNAKSRTIILPA